MSDVDSGITELNEGQRAAVEYGIGDGRPPPPLLIIAGAGTGKTKTLAHRVAHLVLNGTDPRRILLLTFTRRAAAEMKRRAVRILAEAPRAAGEIARSVAANDISAVIGLAAQGHSKHLFSTKLSGEKPQLIGAADESAQVQYVVDRILEHREAGINLKRQAVLFRAAHHSAALEVELGRRKIPFVKYGGLKFLEAAHIKDVLCVLRWAENPKDAVAGFRVLQLLPGIGPTAARNVIGQLSESNFVFKALKGVSVSSATAPHWSEFCASMSELGDSATPWIGQVDLLRRWYQPHLERLYDNPMTRIGDLEKLEQIAAGYATRERFLTELTLDPPDATGTEAGTPLLDEDYLILSTIHSAKGQEWDAVFILNVADGCIPSDMAAGSAEQIEEERRILGVAMTRAKLHLHLIQPLRFFRSQQHRYGDSYVFAPRSRFIPNAILDLFECRAWPVGAFDGVKAAEARARGDIAARMREMWR